MEHRWKQIIALALAVVLVIHYNTYISDFIQRAATDDVTETAEMTETAPEEADVKVVESAPAPQPEPVQAEPPAKQEEVPVVQNSSSGSEASEASEASSAESAEAPEGQGASGSSEHAVTPEGTGSAGSPESEGAPEGAGSQEDAVNPEIPADSETPADTGNAESPEDTPTPEDAEEEQTEETVKMPAQTFRGSAGGVTVVVSAPEGAFPEGTAMKVSAVSQTEVMDAVQQAVDEEVVRVRAVDITFYDKDGKEIQPKKNVTVSMRASGMDASQDHEVVHIGDDGDASVVGADVSGNSANFQSKDFSIYVIAEMGTSEEDTEEEKAVATYEFYIGSEKVSEQTVKKGDVLYEPAMPELTGEQEFAGWFTVGEDSSQVAFGEVDSVEAGAVVRVEARIRTVWYIIYDGESDEIVQIQKVVSPDGSAVSVKLEEISITPNTMS